MMQLLLIDTCGTEGSVALAEGATPKVVAVETLPGRSASERLVSVIRQRMEVEGWRLGELAAIGVVYGPGSFTGVRVGLSAAKGLSEAGGIPMVAVSRLALLAAAAGSIDGTVCAVLDAGRGEFYCGMYAGMRKMSESLLARDEVAAASVSATMVVACELRVFEALRELGPRLVAEPGAGDALPFVVERVEAGEFEDAATIDANYLRRMDLEISAKTATLNVTKDAGC